MNTELIPGVVAVTGGSLMLGGIAVRERRRDEAMRASRVRLGLRFPLGMEASQVVAALDGVSGLSCMSELVVEIAADEHGIKHALWVPENVRYSVVSTLAGAIPSLGIAEAAAKPGVANASARLWVPTPCLISTDAVESTSRTLLAGLSGLRGGERVVVRHALRAGNPRVWREPENPSAQDRDLSRRWQKKTSGKGFRASGLVLARAQSTDRAAQLMAHVESVIRSRRTIGKAIRTTRERPCRSFATLPRVDGRSGWLSGGELAALIGWPVGAEVVPGVTLGAARQLPVPAGVSSRGRVLLIGRGWRGERPVALSVEAAKHHLTVVGPTGTGKSTLLANAILADIKSGFGGVVFDGKGPDLVNTVLNHLPREHADRVVVLDPADLTRAVPAVALLSGGDRDLAAEVLTGALRSIFADVWGVRSDFYAGLAIRTLAEMPSATLADIARLFLDDGYRRGAVSRLSDSYLVSCWQSYEELSDAAKVEHIQAPMQRVMGLLARPRVRSVLANRTPTLDIGRLLAQRRFLLISLSPGQLGEAATSLLATALLYVVWSAIEARSGLPVDRRHPVFVYMDELASLVRLPFSFELLAERARGLGAGLTVATQTLGRIPEPTRSALLANSASLVSFRSSVEAARIAGQLPGLSERDLTGLDRFEVAARIGTGRGGATSVVTGHTLPLPAPTGMAGTIRNASAARYGAAAEQPEKTIPAPEPQDRPGRIERAS